MESSKLLYSRKEGATALSLGVRTLDQLILAGKIPIVRVGRRVLIAHETLRRFAITGEQEQSRKGDSGEAK